MRHLLGRTGAAGPAGRPPGKAGGPRGELPRDRLHAEVVRREGRDLRRRQGAAGGRVLLRAVQAVRRGRRGKGQLGEHGDLRGHDHVLPGAGLHAAQGGGQRGREPVRPVPGGVRRRLLRLSLVRRPPPRLALLPPPGAPLSAAPPPPAPPRAPAGSARRTARSTRSWPPRRSTASTLLPRRRAAP